MWAWDDSSRLIGRTDDNGIETVYEYDPLARMNTEVSADCTQTAYVYDVHHNPILITDANGSVITCEYDLLDRKETITGVADPADAKTIASCLYIGRNRVAQRDYGNHTRMTHA